jgi:hypothetical protein
VTWVYVVVFRIGVFVLLGSRLSRGVVWAWFPGSLVSLCISWVIVPVSM